jgi:predicted nuclease with TOPRIM domain
MDLNTLKKAELILEIERLQGEVKKAQGMQNLHKKEMEKMQDEVNRIEEYKEVRNEAIKNEHALKRRVNELEDHIRQEKEIFQKTLKKKDEEHQFLVYRFDTLAAIFDEYIQAFDDQLLLFKTLSRTNTYAKQILEQKIKNFNNPQPVVDEGDEKE